MFGYLIAPTEVLIRGFPGKGVYGVDNLSSPGGIAIIGRDFPGTVFYWHRDRRFFRERHPVPPELAKPGVADPEKSPAVIRRTDPDLAGNFPGGRKHFEAGDFSVRFPLQPRQGAADITHTLDFNLRQILRDYD